MIDGLIYFWGRASGIGQQFLALLSNRLDLRFFRQTLSFLCCFAGSTSLLSVINWRDIGLSAFQRQFRTPSLAQQARRGSQ